MSSSEDPFQISTWSVIERLHPFLWKKMTYFKFLHTLFVEKPVYSVQLLSPQKVLKSRKIVGLY